MCRRGRAGVAICGDLRWSLAAQLDVGAGSVAVDLNCDIVEARFAPRVKRMPEAAWLFRAEHAHVEPAVAVCIFIGAERPAAWWNLEMK